MAGARSAQDAACGYDPVDDDNLILDALKHFVVVVLIGALALWLMPGLTRASAEAIRRRPLASFGSGLLAALGWLLGVIGVVVVIVLAAIIFGLIGFGGCPDLPACRRRLDQARRRHHRPGWPRARGLDRVARKPCRPRG